MSRILTTSDHARDSVGLKYVYPVLSRRAGGLSVGINFNTNNACNWRCVYCQVADLQRGSAPVLDFDLLEKELRHFLKDVLHGDFFDRFAIPAEQRLIKDIALSGNGEPTSLPNFSDALRLIAAIATDYQLFPHCNWVLISNGSLLHKDEVQHGLAVLRSFGGELWFKLDSATVQGRLTINNVSISQQSLLTHLKTATQLCVTKLQTCVFRYQDRIWTSEERKAYLQLLVELKQQQIDIRKVMLYGIARPSLQPESVYLEKMPEAEMDALAADITALGYDVSVSY